MADSLRERLVAVVSSLDVTSRPRMGADLRALYADDVVFQDPMQRTEGIDAFVHAMDSLLKMSRRLSFHVMSAAGTDEEMFLVWTMKMTPRRGPTVTIDGMSHLRSREGKISYHRDYWDLANGIASAVPGGERVLRAVMKPFV
jgi:hypothetical protein